MEQTKSSKLLISFILFIVVMFIVTNVANFYQSSYIDSTIQNRVVVSDEILVLVKEQAVKLDELKTALNTANEKLASLENNSKKPGLSK